MAGGDFPIDCAAGAGEDKAAYPSLPGRIEQMDRAEHVDLSVAGRFTHTDRDAGLRGLMADDIRPKLAEYFLDRFAAADVDREKRRRVGHVFAPARAQVVQARDVVARREGSVHDVAADETRRARDQDSHL